MDNINEDSVGIYLTNHCEEISDELTELSSNKNFVGMIQALINYINFLIKNNQVQKIGTKFKLIGWFYKRGNEHVQFIIENLFVRSFVGIKKRCNSEQWKLVYQSIPDNLKKIYLSQINNYSMQKFTL